MLRDIIDSTGNTSDVSEYHLPFTTLAHNLKKVGDELQLTVKGTEEEFLSIGSSLKEFYGRSENISRMSSNIAHLLSGEEISDTIHRLGILVAKMNDNGTHSRNQNEQRITMLKDLLKTMSGINELLEHIKTSIKSLKMLGVTTRIYSNNESNFNVLASEVKRLAADMTSKTMSIPEGLKSLSSKVRDTLTKVQGLNVIQQTRTQEILEKTLSSLAALIEKRALSVDVAKDTSRISAETSRSIAEIVKFLQFHDIIYQQIEQIKDGFYSLNPRFDGAACEGNLDDSAVAELLFETGSFCDFQADQLSHHRDEMTSAVNSIIENLRTINHNVTDISRKTRYLAGESDEKKQSFLTETRNGLSAVSSAISALAENARVSKGLSKNITSIVFDEISIFLEEVGPIQDEMELMALNAAVKAANMEKGGEILNVIAESVQKLSLDVRGQTSAVLDIFRSMTSVTRELSASIDDEDEREAQVSSIVSEFEILSDSFNRITGDIASLLAEVDKEGRELSDGIDSAIKGIRIHDVVSDVCNRVIAEMKRIASISRSVASATDGLDREVIPPAVLEDQMQRVGRRCISVGVEDALHFDQDNGGGDSFDDNVELF